MCNAAIAKMLPGTMVVMISTALDNAPLCITRLAMEKATHIRRSNRRGTPHLKPQIQTCLSFTLSKHFTKSSRTVALPIASGPDTSGTASPSSSCSFLPHAIRRGA